MTHTWTPSELLKSEYSRCPLGEMSVKPTSRPYPAITCSKEQQVHFKRHAKYLHIPLHLSVTSTQIDGFSNSFLESQWKKKKKKNHIIFSFLSPVGSGSTWKSLTLSAVTYWPFVWWAQFLHRLLNNNDTQKIQPEGKVAEIMTQRTNTKVLLCALLM